MKKGVSLTILLILIAILGSITSLGTYLFVSLSTMESIRRSITERAIVAEINNLELIKINLHQALDYSFYQASYYISRHGGYLPEDINNPQNWPYWVMCQTVPQVGRSCSANYRNLPLAKERLPEWRIHSTILFPDIVISLSKNGQMIFDEYLKSLKEKSDISIPGYRVKDVNIFDTFIDIFAFNSSGEGISLEKRDIGEVSKLNISENSDMTEKVKITLGKLVDFGKNNFLTSDSIGKGVMSVASQKGFMPSASMGACGWVPSPEQVFICTHTPTASGCPNYQGDSVDPMTISKAEGILFDPISKKIEGMGKDLSKDGFNVELFADQKTNFIFPNCTSNMGGCCRACEDDGCCAYYWTTTCDFYYYGGARVMVDITETTTKYAVYDHEEKSPDLRNLQLKFYVFPGN